MKIVVAILNYNGQNWLEKFLPSVIERSPEAEVVVIDNASTDNSISFLENNFSSIRLIVNPHNSGFAGGYNEGLKQIEADYYVLLNSDIEVTENWINPVIELIETTPNAVAGQPKVIAYNNQSHFEHAGAAGGFIDRWGYPFCRGRIFTYTEEDKGQFDDSQEVFWATGACLFIKADVYHSAGGLDDNFFAHMEEIDLCWRLQNNGHKIVCEPKSTVKHVGGGTLDYRNPRKTYLNFRNSLYAIHKNWKGALLPIIFLRLCLDGLAGAKFLLSGDVKHVISIFKAHIHYYKHIGTLSKQRKINTKKKFKTLTGVYPKSIVFSFYLKGKKNFKDLNPWNN